MSKIYTSADQLIGHTPLLELTHIEKKEDLNAHILAKLEYFNPAGSVKDRIAKGMIDDAEAKGALKPGSVIIEPTSGNTGIGLASVAAARGYRIIIVMPETMSVERRQLMKAYGAELVLSEGAKGMKGAIAKANELAAEIPNSFIPGQFVNPANPAVHTARPPARKSGRIPTATVDIFVAGVGTGGTITGVGEYLKEQNPNVKVVAVEPATSPVLSQGRCGRAQDSGHRRGLCAGRAEHEGLRRDHRREERGRVRDRPRDWPQRGRAGGHFFRRGGRMRRFSWRSARKTRARTSSCFCRTPATAICPRRCSRSKGRRNLRFLILPYRFTL